jgi:hypothetical protein
MAVGGDTLSLGPPVGRPAAPDDSLTTGRSRTDVLEKSGMKNREGKRVEGERERMMKSMIGAAGESMEIKKEKEEQERAACGKWAKNTSR